MDRKKLHEQFVTGYTGSSIADIYTTIFTCVLGILTSFLVSKTVKGSATATVFTDFIFNWACTLISVTLYSRKHAFLAVILSGVCILAYISNARPKSRNQNRSHKESRRENERLTGKKDVKLDLRRSAMMILTITAILAVDFPIFPRRFAKAETWGTSLMDLGVGSFVFSMCVVSSRQSLKFPKMTFGYEMKKSCMETLNLIILGVIRLFSLKMLDYHEHVSEYGVHWNFFFTLGFLPMLFTIAKRFPVGNILMKAIIVAVGYELILKNTGLLEWILTAPRTGLISQNKEGVCSFLGYLSIFTFGNAFGERILLRTVLLKSIIKTAGTWTVLFHVVLWILRYATEPSRRLANLPYIIWVVAFNSGLIFALSLVEYLFDVKPSRSHVAVNKYGNTVFVLGNLVTGIVNLCINTIGTDRFTGILVLLCYQIVMMTACEVLLSRS